RRARFQLVLSGLAQELSNLLQLAVAQVLVGEFGRFMGREHFHLHHVAAVRVVRQVFPAQVTREMQHAPPLPSWPAGGSRPGSVMTDVPFHPSQFWVPLSS